MDVLGNLHLVINRAIRAIHGLSGAVGIFTDERD